MHRRLVRREQRGHGERRHEQPAQRLERLGGRSGRLDLRAYDHLLEDRQRCRNADGRGLDDARVLADYEDHSQGWEQILPRLAPYAETLVTQR